MATVAPIVERVEDIVEEILDPPTPSPGPVVDRVEEIVEEILDPPTPPMVEEIIEDTEEIIEDIIVVDPPSEPTDGICVLDPNAPGCSDFPCGPQGCLTEQRRIYLE